MKNLRTKLILMGVVAGAIVIGVLIYLQATKENPELTIIKENFTRCQNFENINITANPEGPPSAITGLDAPVEYAIRGGKSIDCLSIHDIYFCNLMDNEEQETFCENTFYLIKAFRENNLDYCEKIGERKLICRAILKRDESLCEKAELEANSSPFTEFRSCKAVIKEDVKECENIEDEIKIQKCKIGYYIILAWLKKDMSLCDKIEGKKRKALLNCKAALDINECLKYHSEVQCPEIYLPQIAQLSKNPSICEGIPYKEEDEKGWFLYQVCAKNAQ